MKISMRSKLAAPFVLTAMLGPGLASADGGKPPKAPDGAQVSPPDAHGKCWVHPSTECPPNVHCNPGPPSEVECPSKAKAGKGK